MIAVVGFDHVDIMKAVRPYVSFELRSYAIEKQPFERDHEWCLIVSDRLSAEMISTDSIHCMTLPLR